MLCIIAADAYKFLKNLDLVDDLPLAAWRHREQKAAYGCESLTKARQNDYATIKGHFQQLAQQDDKAYLTYLKDDDKIQKQTQTFWHLEQQAELIGSLLVRAGKAQDKTTGQAYILAAAKRILGQPSLTWLKIKDLDPNQIGNLVINAKRNLKSLQKKHPETSL